MDVLHILVLVLIGYLSGALVVGLSKAVEFVTMGDIREWMVELAILGVGVGGLLVLGTWRT
jgi:uncharacterized membrane protein